MNIPIDRHGVPHSATCSSSSEEAKSLVVHQEEAEEGVDQALAVLVDVELGRGGTGDGAHRPDAHEGPAEGEADDEAAVLDVAELVQPVDVERAPGVVAVVERGVAVDEPDDEEGVVVRVLERDGERLVVGDGGRGRAEEAARLGGHVAAAASHVKRGQGPDKPLEPGIHRVGRGLGGPAAPSAPDKETVLAVAALAIDLGSKSLEAWAATTKLLGVEVGDVDVEGVRLEVRDGVRVRRNVNLHGVHLAGVRVVRISSGIGRTSRASRIRFRFSSRSRGRGRRCLRARAAVVAALVLDKAAHESDGRLPGFEIRRRLHVDEDEDDPPELVDVELQRVDLELNGQEVAAETPKTELRGQVTAAGMVLKATKDQEDKGPSVWCVVRNGQYVEVVRGRGRKMMVLLLMMVVVVVVVVTATRESQ